ncbi:putative membrane protein [Brucella pseudogrignonensis]|nr:putative membrane protein [Brucella pseudogrignonensis]
MTTGEWLAWSAAVVTALAGLIMLFAPGITMKLLRLQPINARPEAYSSIRAVLAGPYLGVGLGCLIFAQPFLWVVLGAVWGFALFGRFISMMSDKSATFYNIVAAVIEFLLAAGPLLYAFGFVS